MSCRTVVEMPAELSGGDTRCLITKVSLKASNLRRIANYTIMPVSMFIPLSLLWSMQSMLPLQNATPITNPSLSIE